MADDILGRSLHSLGCKDMRARPKIETFLSTECHRLFDVPVGQYSVENLRIMIGQNIGLRFLIPVAIEKLDLDPFLSGDYYAGDLLKAVATADPEYWRSNPEVATRFNETIKGAERLSALLKDKIAPAWETTLNRIWI